MCHGAAYGKAVITAAYGKAVITAAYGKAVITAAYGKAVITAKLPATRGKPYVQLTSQTTYYP